MTTAVRTALVEMQCRNPYCPYLLKKGQRLIVSAINDRGRLWCGSCRAWDFYEVRE